MNQTDLRHKLSAPFDFNEWKNILAQMFPKIDYLAKATSVDASLVKNGGQIGVIHLNDGRSLGLFKFEVADNIHISRNRKGLREIAAKYVDQDIIHGALVLYFSVIQTEYRLTFISKQTVFDPEGNLSTKETAPKRYTFLLGESEPCTTAASRLMELVNKNKRGFVYLDDVTEAFSVDRLNKDFFNGYKSQYKKFLLTLADTKQNRDYIKKLLGRLVFLQFLQKKGWMGVPASNKGWEGGNKNYLKELIHKYEGNDRLLSDVLETLFFKTLNEERDNDIADKILGQAIKIPYLNGGLFDKDKIDNLDIDFPYSYFKDLMDFFAIYNFTIDENDPEDSEVGIDPEMLGHIFENLLEDNKDKGAFYTPKEIVQYMSKESIAQYLKAHTNEIWHDSVDNLIRKGVVDVSLQDKNSARMIYRLLQDIKVCDPAIGSGAFPMGVLYVLYHTRQLLYGFTKTKEEFSPAKIKREIIQNNIFGVDIEQGAVDIARLRFWLALVVDETYPQPLPNLDYKIVCGNSLLNRYGLEEPLNDVFKEYNEQHNEEELMSLEKYKQMVANFTNTSNHAAKAEFKKTIDCIKSIFRHDLTARECNKLRKLRSRIIDLESPSLFESTKQEKDLLKKLVKQFKELEKEQTDLECNKLYEDAFEWRFEFPQLLDDDGNFIGFDLIIGNPPYGAKLSKEEKKIYKERFSDVHMRTPETYCYFISQALRLATSNSAIVTYIVPNNMFFQSENEKTREMLAFNNQLVRAINLGDNTFENADVPTCIFICKTGLSSEHSIQYSDYRSENVKDIDWYNNISDTSTEMLRTVPSYVIGIANNDINILNIIKEKGVTIDCLAEEMASGISTGGDKIFRVHQKLISELSFESTPLHKVLVGAEIDKYSIKNTQHFIIYSTKQSNIPQYHNIFNYLLPHEEKLSKKRETLKGLIPWWCLHWPRYGQLFNEPKIIMRQTSDSIRCVYDEFGYYTLDSILVFKTKNEDYDYKYISTILNSTLTDYLYKQLTQEEGRTFAQVKPANVRKLYIPKATKEEQSILSNLYDYMEILNNPICEDLDLRPLLLNLFEQIIDGCVYELFFREHMRERGIDIMQYLQDYIDPLSDCDYVGKYNQIIAIHSKINSTDNEIRRRLKLFVSRSSEYLKPIIQH